MRWAAPLFFCISFCAAGCLPDVGDGDEALARTVVYTATPEGLPAYAGQALIQRSCANGRCHSESATGMDRNGAPFGLDFDVNLASDAESTELLRRGQLKIVQERRVILSVLEDESMPPGEIGDEVRDGGTPYRDLPEIDTPEGLEIVRNWLAARAPVVERVRDDRPTGTEPVGAIESPNPECEQTLCGGACVDPMIDRNNCGDCGMPCAPDQLCMSGACAPCAGMVSFAADVAPVFERNGCNVAGCHAGASPSGALGLEDGMAHAMLVDVPSTCSDGRSLVTSGLVNGSYLFNKLTGLELCSGGRMPLGTVTGISPAELQTVEAWICGGALDD